MRNKKTKSHKEHAEERSPILRMLLKISGFTDLYDIVNYVIEAGHLSCKVLTDTYERKSITVTINVKGNKNDRNLIQMIRKDFQLFPLFLHYFKKILISTSYESSITYLLNYVTYNSGRTSLRTKFTNREKYDRRKGH
jgi:hypothetical protein